MYSIPNLFCLKWYNPIGNSGHAVVPKARIGKVAIVILKDKDSRTGGKKANAIMIRTVIDVFRLLVLCCNV